VTLTGPILYTASERMRPSYLTLGCLKDTFLCFEVKSVLLKDVKDLTTMVWCCLFHLAAEDEDVSM